MFSLERSNRSMSSKPNKSTAHNKKTQLDAAQVCQPSIPKQNSNNKEASILNRLQSCVPTDTKTFLFTLVAIVYLIAAILHFFGWKGDTSMLTTLLEIIGGYRGLSEVTSVLSKGIGEKNDLS